MDLFLDQRVAEEGSNQLGRTFRLIAAGKAARHYNHLGCLQFGREFIDRGHDILCRQVPQNHDFRVCPGFDQGPGCVIFTVGAREHRNQCLRLRGDNPGSRRSLLFGMEGVDLRLVFVFPGRFGRIDAFQHPGIELPEFVNGHPVVADADLFAFGSPADQPAETAVLIQFGDDGTRHRFVPVNIRNPAVKADFIAEGHLDNCFRQTVFHGPGCLDMAGSGQFMEAGVHFDLFFRGGAVKQDNRMVSLLEFRGQYFCCQQRGDRERDQGRRDILVQERTGHRVLAADSRCLQFHLGIQGTQQGAERLAPALRLIPQLLKEFLEGQIDLLPVGPGRDQLGRRDIHVVVGPLVRVHAHLIRVKAPGHDAGLFGLLIRLDREQRSHDLCRGSLQPAAERHQHCHGPDRIVKPLGQALAAGALQTGRHIPQGMETDVGQAGPVLFTHCHSGMLGRAVGIQESPGQIDNGAALPFHDHARIFGDDRDPVGFEVFLVCFFNELRFVFRRQYDSHALLGFGDGQLRAVQAFVLLADRVKIDLQAVREFTDGDTDTAGPEVVAPLDQPGDFRVVEQPQDFSFFRRVALLDFGSHGLQGLQVMALGGAGCPADAVPAGPAAQQDDHITGCRTFPYDIFRRRGPDDRTALQPLGHKAFMIQFGHMPGSQADLVAVGRIPGRGCLGDLALRQFARQGLRQRGPRVRAAGQAHGLVDIDTSGQRVTDTAADAGCRPAERFDFRRVVVRFILEHQQPVFFPAVNDCRYMDRAGIDFFGFIQLRQKVSLLQGLGPDRGQIHQGFRPGQGLFAVDFLPQGLVPLIGRPDFFIFDFHVVDLGAEGRMPAVVGPVGINDPDFRNSRVTFLFIPEVSLQELQVIKVHGQAHTAEQFLQAGVVQLRKAFGCGDMVRRGIFHPQGFRQFEGSLTGFHRVDHMMPDHVDFFCRQIPVEHIDSGKGHQRPVLLAEQLDALGRGVCPLVKLTRQGFHAEDGTGPFGFHISRDNVQLRFGEDRPLGLLKQVRIDSFHIIAVQNPHIAEILQTQERAEIRQGPGRFRGKPRFLFYIYAINHFIPPRTAVRAVRYRAGNTHWQSRRLPPCGKLPRWLLPGYPQLPSRPAPGRRY